MIRTVAKPRRWGWLLLDLAATAVLALGLLALLAPAAAADAGIAADWAIPLIAIGGIGMLAAMALFIRQWYGRPGD